MANDFITVTRTLVKRGWSDIEPKIAVALVSGGAANIVLAIANAYHIPIPLSIQPEIPYALAVLAGYLTPSSGQTIIKHVDTASGSHIETEQHTGSVESTITNSTPIQKPAGKFDNILNQLPSAPVVDPNAPTQILPDRPF